MILTNYHIHTSYCDGHGEMQAFVDEALRLRLQSIGFSSHAPLPFSTGWTMPAERLGEYLAAIARLKAAKASQLEIYAGLEVDYVPGGQAFRRELLDRAAADYVIGSVHLVGGETELHPWTVDGSIEGFDRGLRVRWGGNIRDLVCEYFRRIRAMVALSGIDVVGHVDRILYNNVDGRLFSATAPWYLRQVEETLQVIAARDLIVELNLAGCYAPLGLPNPTPPVLRRCHKLGIRVTVATDAHCPQDVGRGLGLAEGLLREAGYREAWRLNRGRWCAEGLG